MAIPFNSGPTIPDTPIAPLPQADVAGIPTSTNQGQTLGDATNASSKPQYPDPAETARLNRYKTNDQLWRGEHIDAFLGLGRHVQLKDSSTRIAWMVCNYAGLISKVCADMLFGEPITVKMPQPDAPEPAAADADQNSNDPINDPGNDGGEETETPRDINPTDPRQEWMDALLHQNKIHTQNYESALSNSRRGDALYKIRVGYLDPGDTKTTVIIEDINPAIYFPQLDPNNIRAKPTSETLAWIVKGTDGGAYLRQEIHTPGQIENKAFRMDGNLIKNEVPIAIFGLPNLQPIEKTGINKSLLVHIPNWRDGSVFYGYDDYADITSLMYSLDNRMTRIDKILEKHADPILTVPEGVLDEKGQVRRKDLEMFEVPSTIGGGATPTPQYITWDASLEAAWKEIDQIMQMLYLFSEVTPDVFGMGQAEVTGRALRLKLMRTVAKINRKRIYYDHGLKEVFFIAQLLAQAANVGVGQDRDMMFRGDPEMPSIEWADGLPIDSYEAAQEEALRLESGTTTMKDSIMRLDGVDEETALDLVDEIKEESKSPVPSIGPTMVFASGAQPPMPDPIKPPAPDGSPATTPNQPAPAQGGKPPAKPAGR